MRSTPETSDSQAAPDFTEKGEEERPSAAEQAEIEQQKQEESGQESPA